MQIVLYLFFSRSHQTRPYISLTTTHQHIHCKCNFWSVLFKYPLCSGRCAQIGLERPKTHLIHGTEQHLRPLPRVLEVHHVAIRLTTTHARTQTHKNSAHIPKMWQSATPLPSPASICFSVYNAGWRLLCGAP